MAKLSVDQTLSKAKSYAKKGEIEEAQKLYQNVLQAFPKNGRAQKGLDDLRQHHAPTATQNPPQELLHRLLGHYQNGRFSDAEKLAVFMTQEFPKHQFAWKVLGALFGATGRNSEAVDANQTAVALSPQDAEAHNNLGNTLKELGRLDEAEASYNQALVLKPDYAEAHCNLGIVLHHSGKLGKAEASYRQAIALKPEFPEAYSNLGITLQEAGKLKEADASYKQAIELSPDYAEAHSNLGNMLKELGRLEEAEASYNQAIALEPNLAEAHNNLGTTLQELGRLEEAKARWKQSLLLQPNFFDGVRNLVKLPVGQLEPDAINLCEKALASVESSQENQIKYLFARGNLFKQQGLAAFIKPELMTFLSRAQTIDKPLLPQHLMVRQWFLKVVPSKATALTV